MNQFILIIHAVCYVSIILYTTINLLTFLLYVILKNPLQRYSSSERKVRRK